MSPNEFCLWHCSAASLKPCAVKKDYSSPLPLPNMLKSGGSTHNHKEGNTEHFLRKFFPSEGQLNSWEDFSETKLLSSQNLCSNLLPWS